MRDAYIVQSIRTPGCKRNKGAFKDTRPEDLLSFILKSAMDKTPSLEMNDVDDIMIGCAFPEAEQGLNIGRIASQIAGFPVNVSGATVNRFCASGLEAIALAALRVMSGWSDVVIGGGLESMTYVPMGGNIPRPHPEYSKKHADLYVSMGITAENVANRYKISREEQDELAYSSQMKAAEAKNKKLFTELVPTPAHKFVQDKDGIYRRETFIVDHDDGIRPSTIEGLAGLNPVFAAGGTVTAGNSSQTTDGAAATIIMSGEKVEALGLKPVAKLKYYTTVGCSADEMGVGPRYAIPKLLNMAGMDLKDIGLFEINEAFASQAVYCIKELGIDMEKVNIHGGAIALGHPLGCTGAKLCATLLANMKERGVKYGIESMCIGGGMGAAALFELCD
ncbi:MAG: thiolase family protein [Deltaproteobacteria bacterium]|nr:thiolase family protein [Deltaproteobacteria bacterium]MBW2671323.1 thiolase family protein [Deltaproteobacteria bacterium]